MKDKAAAFEKYKADKKCFLKENLPIRHMRLRKSIRPLLRTVLFVQRKIKGQSIEVIGNKKIKKVTGTPIVFVVTHIGKYDFEIVNEKIKEHFYVIASDFLNMYGNINGIFMKANGVIFMDIDDKEDRENSRQMMLRVLKQGDNMMIFPEGTWNLSENAIINDLHWGVADISLEASAIIVPIAIEQFGKRFVVNIGELFDPDEIRQYRTETAYSELGRDEVGTQLKRQIKMEVIQKLRDILATLKFQIWEKEGTTRRDSIPYDYWLEFIKERCAEWPGYSMDEQVRNGCFPPVKREYNAMLKEMGRIRISKKNSFLFQKIE